MQSVQWAGFLGKHFLFPLLFSSFEGNPGHQQEYDGNHGTGNEYGEQQGKGKLSDKEHEIQGYEE